MKSILDSPTISGRAFFPRNYDLDEVKLLELSGTTLAYHHTVVDPTSLTLLHFHGNGETIADYVNGQFHQFYELGINIVFVEYRGYGQSFGVPELVAMLDDGEEFVKGLGLSFDRVVAFGRSMGSLYSIELAARQPTLAGLVIESGIHDLAERLNAWGAGPQFSSRDIEDECQTYFDHDSKLGKYPGPILILHAERDHIIDISHAEHNHQANPNRSTLARLPHGDHSSVMPFNVEQYFSELRSFLRLSEN